MLRVIDNLFAVAPEETTDTEIIGLVHNAVLQPTTSQRARTPAV